MLFMFIIIDMVEFECKGCGTVLYLIKGEDLSPVCPECRGAMGLVEDSASQADLEEFECSECGGSFYMEKEKFPYKCPFCNYTFSVSPRLRQQERL